MFALGRFDKAIEHFSSVMAKDPNDIFSLGERAMLYSRTGQYAKAEADIGKLAKTFPLNFMQFYHLYWKHDLDAAQDHFRLLEEQRYLLPFMKVWGCFLLGRIEDGLDYLEHMRMQAAELRTRALYALTPSIVRQVTSHPRYLALLTEYRVDDAWRDELMAMTNELESITGIRVSLDEDY